MDRDCDRELRLGINISSGTTTRAEDLKPARPRPVQGPPLDLNLFPLTSVLPPASGSSNVLPASGTLPWKNTSAGIDAGSDDERSAGEAKAAIHRVPVSKRFDVKKFLARHHSEEAAAINCSSSNSTMDTNAITSESGYAMDFKRKRTATEELENEKVCSRVLSDVEEEGSTKKKPRLSQEQYALLEERFSKNRMPRHNEKQALAKELNLPPHQVGVWFQNKRARMKSNQKELDYNLLKKYNELLLSENKRLEKELQELKSLKLASPMCPSCQRTTAANNSRPSGLATP